MQLFGKQYEPSMELIKARERIQAVLTRLEAEASVRRNYKPDSYDKHRRRNMDLDNPSSASRSA